MKRALIVAAAAAGTSILALASCGGGVGACVSGPVDYSYGQRVYCYDGWDESDCDTNNTEQVNGASWTFYEGDECSDRDLTTGSNPWP